MATLLALPRELHVEIFGYLSHFDHYRLGQTCKQLEQLLLYDSVRRAARYHSREGDEHQYHKLLYWKTHSLSDAFGCLFCTAKGGVVQRYTFLQGYEGRPFEEACTTGLLQQDSLEIKGGDASNGKFDNKSGEEAEENVIILRQRPEFFRFQTTDISSIKFLDEPCIIPRPHSVPISTEETMKIKFSGLVENVQDTDCVHKAEPENDDKEEYYCTHFIDTELSWDEEIEISKNWTVRRLIEYFMEQSQLRMEKTKLGKNARTENILLLAHKDEVFRMGIWQHVVQDDMRRYVWYRKKNSEFSRWAYDIWRSERLKGRTKVKW
ncbi:hypothetical protein TWF694_003601 [Orbilia ellipsospora]|uniref:F-box domain-containing protein n=1 Tax=Orbilia ellipsospora TaxID=2528407 RepID=A0AAV9WYK7_9PEZI